MENFVDRLQQAASIALDLIKYVCYKLGYELDTTTIASTLVSLIAIYFTIITIYRTTTYAIKTLFWLAKWALIFWVVAGTVGFFMAGGQRGFTVQPVVEALFALSLRMLGWGSLPDVRATPDGLTVNGIPLELPEDYHQYGAAWNKFKSRSASKKKSGNSRSIFDAFDSKKSASSSSSSSKKKGKDKAQSNKSDTPAAAIARGILGDKFDYDAAAEAMQSVEAIQKGVADSFEALRKAVLGGQPESPPPERNTGWASWWPFTGNDDENGGTASR